MAPEIIIKEDTYRTFIFEVYVNSILKYTILNSKFVNLIITLVSLFVKVI